MIDKWRWDVFSGQVQPTDYNRRWWTLRERNRGVAPPVNRTDDDFDPGAKYHIPSNTPYVRFLFASIYQFQFYRAMCRAAGYTGPLNRCSFYESKAAGAKLEAMLSLGASKPWPEALKAMTGEDRADASAIMEYFNPLLTWLRNENKRVKIGWTVAVDPMLGS
jgi:peptidyl-dipeptidase A